ncbi:MAG: hypothetical protein KDC38_10405 [Planctomycetes bacterium]|nr:hypothetical protein [Planctomycetota bacterium]
MPTYRYCAYPEAKVVDDEGNQIQHLLWGDWVRVEDDPPHEGWHRVHCRGVDGWLHEDDLQDERLLEIVFVDVGQGDGCLIVTPRDEHLIVDAGISDNMFRFLKWRYAGFKKRWTFKAAVITHPDQDHYAGFEPLFAHENIHFGAVYHNGVMEEWSPNLGPSRKVGDRRYLTHVVQTREDLAAFLAEEKRWKKASGNRTSYKQYPRLFHGLLEAGRTGDVRMLWTEAGQRHWMPGFGESASLSIEVLGPILESVEGQSALRAFGDKPTSRSLDVGKTKNGHSVVLKVKYGDISLLLGGDLNRSAEHFLLGQYSGLDHDYPYSAAEEDAIVAAARSTFAVDVVKSCHHGSADVTDAMLRALDPAVIVVSSGDEESHAHPRPETLGALGRYGRGRRPLLFSTELMRSTRENEGDARERVGRLRERIASAANEESRRTLQSELDALVDELTKRNVTVYGAINLRTDGRKILMAYKLERERTGQSGGRKLLTKWDTYRLEKAGTGPVVYESV